MKKNNIFQKIHDNSKLGKYALYTLLYAVLFPFYFIGAILWIATRPLIVLTHLLMFNFHAAKEVITDWRPSMSYRNQ